MTTRITDFHQPSTVTVQSLETGGAGVASSFGPANVLRLRSDATMWSTSGAQLSLKSLGANSLLLAKTVEIIMPVEIRWKNRAGNRLLPNMYDIVFGSVSTQGTGQAESIEDGTMCKEFNSISVRPLGFLRSIQNMVITINGSSFQVRPDEFLDAYEALYYNGRYDDDGATASPPFNNIGSAWKSAISEPGRFQRCQNMVKNSSLISVDHNDHTHDGDSYKLIDAVYQYNLKTKLPLAFFIYACFPALENLTGNSLDSAAHVTDLAVEYTFKNECPLMHWFATPCTELINAQAIDLQDARYPEGTSTAGDMRLNTNGGSGPDAYEMWRTVTAVEESISSKPGVFVNIRRPYLSYVMVEPDVSKTPLLSAYTMPGINFVSYSKEVAIPGNSAKGEVNFDYIKIDKLSPLITISVCDSEKDGIGGAIGARTARFSSGQYHELRRGMSYSGVTCPIDLSSLKINLSVRNQVLGSLDGSLCTERDFYRMFLKYSKLKISFSDWQKYMKGVLVFSPMELCGVGFAGAYAPYTLSISFSFARACGDTELVSRDYARKSNAGGVEVPSKKWDARAMNYKVTLCFLQESLITLSPGACGIEYPRFSQQEAAAQFSGAQVRLDEGVLDQFVNTAQ